MANPSPYRSLTPERRVALVKHAVSASRQGRAHYVQRLVARGGGFRAVTLMQWPADRLATEVVRLNAERPEDELDLLQLLYLELEPAIQITMLDSAGVSHDQGKIPDELTPPYADSETTRRAVEAVRAKHGGDGEHYLRTLVRYSRESWPGIEEMVGKGEG